MTKSIKGVVALLQESIDTLTNHFRTLAIIITIIFIPFIAYLAGIQLVTVSEGNVALISIGGILTAVGYVALIIASLWSEVALIEASDKLLDNKTYTMRKMFTFDTWSLILQKALAGLLAGLLFLIGGMFFIIPGIIFFVWFAFFQYAVVLERKYDLYALSYSYRIVKGRWWGTFWRLLAFGVLLAVALLIAMLAIMGLSWLLGMIHPIAAMISEGVATVLVFFVIFYLISPLAYLYGVLLYKELKKTSKSTT